MVFLLSPFQGLFVLYFFLIGLCPIFLLLPLWGVGITYPALFINLNSTLLFFLFIISVAMPFFFLLPSGGVGDQFVQLFLP